MIWDQLYPFQQEAAKFAIARPGAALFAEQGTGKTHITLGIIEQLRLNEGSARRIDVLAIVPLSNITTTWDKHLRHLSGIQLCHTLAEYRSSPFGSRILLLHYEAVHAHIKWLRNQHWTLVVYDESQRIKGRGTKQSRDAAKFKFVDHRVVLSGTPIEQSPQDLWAQFRFCCPDVLGTRWADFDSEWLKPTGFMGYLREFKWNKLPLFLKLIEPHMLRVTKKEVLNLPTLSFIPSQVLLLGEQRRVYEDLQENWVTTVTRRQVICDMAITQLIRLQQVTGGFVRTDPERDELHGAIVRVGDAKLRRLRAIVEREEHPIVVFVKYLEEIDIIQNALQELHIGIIRGKTRKTRTQTIEAFQRGEIDVLICQIRTGGVGIDLFQSHVAIFYSLTHSSIDFDQAVSRLHRHGQKNPVRIYLISAKNTVDESILDLILKKQLVVKRVLRRKENGKVGEG